MHTVAPFAYTPDSLAPAFPKALLDAHVGVYTAHVAQLNEETEHSPLSLSSLDETLEKTASLADHAFEHGLAAECWAHAMYFGGMTDIEARRKPSDNLVAQLDLHFDGATHLKQLLAHHVHGLFGNGWIYVVARDGQLDLVTTRGGESLLQRSDPRPITPIFALDAWEHAYFSHFGLDVQAYVDAWWRCQDLVLADELLTPALEAAGVARTLDK